MVAQAILVGLVNLDGQETPWHQSLPWDQMVLESQGVQVSLGPPFDLFKNKRERFIYCC